MTATKSTSGASVLTTEPSDPYSDTPEVAPERLNSEERSDKECIEESEHSLSINDKAYNALKKADPHWATTFYPNEVSGQRWRADFLYRNRQRYFEMLAEIHKGRQNGPTWEHSELRTYELRKHLVEVIGEMLNMTARQIDQAIARATNVDGEEFGQRLELLVFCTCAYVVHQDETGYAKDRDYHPNRDENDELFEEVAETLALQQFRIDNVCRKFDQKFTDELPPIEFDERKPDWKPECSEEVESSASVTPEERVGHCWKGGI